MLPRLSARTTVIALGVMASFLGNFQASQAIISSNTENTFTHKDVTNTKQSLQEQNFLAQILLAQTLNVIPYPSEDRREQGLDRALLNEDVIAPLEESVEYSYNKVDLNGDGKKEAIVYLENLELCDSGECHIFIFEPVENDYRLVSLIGGVYGTPIIVSDRKTNGWYNLILPRKKHYLDRTTYTLARFNGKKYIKNGFISSKAEISGRAYLADREDSSKIVLRWETISNISASVSTQISGHRVNVRLSPSTQSPILYAAKKGDKVKIIQQTRSDDGYAWFHVESQDSGNQGWIRSDLLKF